MLVGIDASRAFIKNRTGVEEYSYQAIKHLACRQAGLRDKLNDAQVVLYLRKNQAVNFELPKNWKIKIIKIPYLWTQIGLSLELLFHPVDTLFVPAHTVPFIHPARNATLFNVALYIQIILKFFGVNTYYNMHGVAGGPKNTIVTIHGLEYEIFPRGYSFWARMYMRWSIKNSCQWAKTIIAVSNNTKNDLIKLYGINKDKIKVIYEGYNSNFKFQISNFKSNPNEQISKPYLLFIGRIEIRKNIDGILDAYKILVEKYNVPYTLVLAGTPGHGYEIIKLKIENYLKIKNLKLKIIEAGFVSEEEKWELLKNADVFLFPTFYEGFGIPILEAQSVGCPVVAGDNSSVREIITIPPSPQTRRGLGRGDDANEQHLPFSSHPQLRRGGLESALLVDPKNAEQIADAAYKLISDKNLRDDIIKKGYENVKRFSWKKCASEIAGLFV